MYEPHVIDCGRMLLENEKNVSSRNFSKKGKTPKQKHKQLPATGALFLLYFPWTEFFPRPTTLTFLSKL